MSFVEGEGDPEWGGGANGGDLFCCFWHAPSSGRKRANLSTGRVRNNSLLKNLSRKMCVCNRSMPSTATMVEYEVSRLSLGVGLHVATSHSASALVEGDFRFDEVQWIICWHLVMWWSFGTYQRFQYDNKIAIPRINNPGDFVLGSIFDVSIEKSRFGSHHPVSLTRYRCSAIVQNLQGKALYIYGAFSDKFWGVPLIFSSNQPQPGRINPSSCLKSRCFVGGLIFSGRLGEISTSHVTMVDLGAPANKSISFNGS